jgi:glycerol kinase
VPVLVIDVGTSSVRAAVVTDDGGVTAEVQQPALPTSPAPGLVEFDAAALAGAAVGVGAESLERFGAAVSGVGVTNQRGSAVVWERAGGRPVGPGLGWQDLRTVGRCLELREAGLAIAPNVAATKIEWLLAAAGRDPDDLAAGTLDAYLAWTLTGGAVHVTDASNAGVTGLTTPDGRGWSPGALAALGIPAAVLPTIVDSSGGLAPAVALPGAPPLVALVGDQQASLAGQGCVTPGPAKITFGTGAMLDRVLPARPPFSVRGPAGTFPITCWRLGGRDTFGIEAVMLSAGSAVEWLRDDLGLIPTAAASHDMAQRCADSGGVWFVPALVGLGTPVWDYGARGTLLGLTRGSGSPEVVRAVLEGVAHRGADLVEAAEADGGGPVEALRIDGGMAANPTFVQALADACGRDVEVCAQREATALGAGYLAGLAVGQWASLAETAGLWRPARVVRPRGATDRDRWRAARARAERWEEALSTVDFTVPTLPA